MKMVSRKAPSGKGRVRPCNVNEGGVFVMSIDRAKLIRDLIDVMNDRGRPEGQTGQF